MAHGQWSEVEARGVLEAWQRSGLSPSARIYFATELTDMRNACVPSWTRRCAANRYEGHFFAFVGKAKDKVKILFWDGGLGDHPKAAKQDRLKSGQRDRTKRDVDAGGCTSAATRAKGRSSRATRTSRSDTPTTAIGRRSECSRGRRRSVRRCDSSSRRSSRATRAQSSATGRFSRSHATPRRPGASGSTPRAPALSRSRETTDRRARACTRTYCESYKDSDAVRPWPRAQPDQPAKLDADGGERINKSVLSILVRMLLPPPEQGCRR
jgi:hypothetical protein